MNIYYDLTYFLKPAGENEINEAAEKIKEEIKKRNGVLMDENAPVKKHLSYPIKKTEDGFFGAIKFAADPEALKLLDSSLKKDQNILRFFVKKIIKKENENNYKKKPVNMFARKKVAQKKQDETELAEIDKKLDEMFGK